MRLFLAINLPTSVKKKLEAQLEPLKKQYPQCSWVSWENYHITIHFFGETNKTEQIKKRLRSLVFDQEKFYLYSSGLDLFINDKILIYLEFYREKKIEKLAETIVESFVDGAINERKFIPHLTIARCKIPSKQQYFVLKKKLERFTIDIHFKAESIVLFQSILGGKKPLYKEIERFRLL